MIYFIFFKRDRFYWGKVWSRARNISQEALYFKKREREKKMTERMKQKKTSIFRQLNLIFYAHHIQYFHEYFDFDQIQKYTWREICFGCNSNISLLNCKLIQTLFLYSSLETHNSVKLSWTRIGAKFELLIMKYL